MSDADERTVQVEDVVWIWPARSSHKNGYPFRVTAISSYTDDGRMYVYGDALTGTGQQVDHLFLLISCQQPLAVPIVRAVARAPVPHPHPLAPEAPSAQHPYMDAAEQFLRERVT